MDVQFLKTRDVQFLKTRSRPKMLSETINEMTHDQKRVVSEMGFGGLLKLTLNEIPSNFARYVVDQLDTLKMVLVTPRGEIRIDRIAVHEILGFPLGFKKIQHRRVSKYDTAIAREWSRHSGDSTDMSKVVDRIKTTTRVDRMFKVDFLLLMSSLMIAGQKNHKINREILLTLPPEFVSKEYDWCEYVVWSVQNSKGKKAWDPSKPDSYFVGPLTFLMLLYCDRVSVMLDPPVLRNRPVIAQWKDKDLVRRDGAELLTGAYGSGEFLIEWRETPEAKKFRSKHIHFEECGCLALEDDVTVMEGEDTAEKVKEDDVDTSEAGISRVMRLLDVNDKDEPTNGPEPDAPVNDEPDAPVNDEDEPEPLMHR